MHFIHLNMQAMLFNFNYAVSYCFGSDQLIN